MFFFIFFKTHALVIEITGKYSKKKIAPKRIHSLETIESTYPQVILNQ